MLRALRDAGYTGYLSSEYEGEREPGARSSRSAATTRSCARSPTRSERGIRHRHEGTHHAQRTHRRRQPARPPRGPRALADPALVPQPVAVVGRHAPASRSTARGRPPTTSRSSCRACGTRSTSSRSRATCSGTCRSTRCSSSRRDDPIALGETHEVEIFGELRLPYMQIAPGQDGGPGMYVPELRAPDADADGDRSGCRGPRARLGRAAAAARDRRRPLQARPHALLRQRRVPRRLVRLRRPARRGSPSSASAPASRSSPRRCCRPTRSCRTSSCATGAPRSTSTGSTRARSARTSTWAAAATAT